MIRKTFKNCLSLRVEEPKSEVNKPLVPEQKSPPVFACVFAYVYVLLLIL